MSLTDRAAEMMTRFDVLSRHSQDPECLTRLYGSAELEGAIAEAAAWMRDAGMTVRRDAFGNLIGRFAPVSGPERPLFIIGGHLDTVRDAGKYDGTFGVLSGIAVVEALAESGRALPFDLEVVGFADEEGLRFHTNYLASRAYAGTFDPALLDRRDADGITVRDAVAAFGGDPERLTHGELGTRRLLGWIEAHIEQGPILDSKDLEVGVVTGIAGQTRAAVSILGEAGHAGTVPMELRKDALMGAAEFALAVEQIARETPGLVATIGQALVKPGASNVIPASVVMTLDMRHPFDDVRERALNEVYAKTAEIAGRRKVGVAISERTDTPANACDERLTASLEQAIVESGRPVRRIVSGAGHDAVALSARMPVTMLFVRCKDGISHNPAESIAEADAEAALEVLARFLRLLSEEKE